METTITTDIEKSQKLLKEGQLVAIPTETVYGLAANALDSNAVKRIFEMKGRPAFNPLIVHIHQMEQLPILAKDIPQKAYDLAEAFWPGSLTLILPKQDIVPDIITGGKPTVGVRMPNHKTTLDLLKGLPFPLAAPSANPFTRVSPTSAKHVLDYFGDQIPAILDGGPCQVGLESTIIGFDGEIPILYRKGGIPKEAIEAVVGKLRISTENETAPEAPGMLLKHYSPRTPLVVCDNLKEKLKENSLKKVGVLSFYEEDFPLATKVIALSKNKMLEEAAMSLFEALHTLDASGLDLILAERFPEKGLGSSINDRLFRAEN
ncbi:L-threonylcarbamoyladenylate synthase [Maribacter cobaltidurans]|uniref:Threonylcarbamoyl-AMP synthase n=1 Tax=Maribacter cobaltidurans TaxID=1178778 RepID=A0A223V3E9_9FLAO|nr:L-threonylcarbamoyladenylate synthase [Maribacter cobaltidurans]ASV29806.1 threonylcarbamoyl-AMP synthase [Maribacter cobaltidurans]GGD92402.1 tRNA threonylcarbamoyladenosine biosynthesis protein [Maribacter cobaltidurans]